MNWDVLVKGFLISKYVLYTNTSSSSSSICYIIEYLCILPATYCEVRRGKDNTPLEHTPA